MSSDTTTQSVQVRERPTQTVPPLAVQYFHQIEKDGKLIGMGNIMWRPAHPMRSGRFPASHPVGGGHVSGTSCMGEGKAMAAFRERGYWASCFPEGDGITMQTGNGQSAKQVAADITDCFGWRVEIVRGDA